MNQIIYFPSLSFKNSAAIRIRPAGAVIVHIGAGCTRAFAVFLEAETIWTCCNWPHSSWFLVHNSISLFPFLSFFLSFFLCLFLLLIPIVFDSFFSFHSFNLFNLLLLLSFLHFSFFLLCFFCSTISLDTAVASQWT